MRVFPCFVVLGFGVPITRLVAVLGPGIRYFPAPSIRVALSGTAVELEGPTFVMRPSSTMTVWSVRVPGAFMGIMFTPTKAVVSAQTEAQIQVRMMHAL